jgi:hypothetical protein
MSTIEPAENAEEYDIIRATGPVEEFHNVIVFFKELVTTAVAGGYEPTGGVSSYLANSSDGPQVTLLQATVRHRS